MNHIHHKFSKIVRTPWIKVKFYFDEPGLNNAKYLKDVRFCEATAQALTQSVQLDRSCISCPGARYVFGWQDADELIAHCLEKTQLSRDQIESIIQQMPRFDNPVECIGLNVENEPDLILSRVIPKHAMQLIGLYHAKTGRKLEASLCNLMSICGGVAARTYLEDNIALSFGCVDSRKYSKLDPNRLVIGIPKKHFNLAV